MFQLHNVHPSRSSVEKFINSFLKYDGVVVLRLINSNAGYVHMSDILHQLWANFYGIYNELGLTKDGTTSSKKSTTAASFEKDKQTLLENYNL